jgi:geranylgeranylglycerol-phosphate geranylgeranyltransferase
VNRIALKSRAMGALQLVRPLNVAMMALGVGIGAILAAGTAAFDVLGVVGVLVAMLSTVAIGAGANVINDVFDCEIDRVNRPDRALPAGIISVPAARWTWVLLSLTGITLAALISWLHAAVAIAATGLLYVYSADLKRRPLGGNVVVGLTIALALIFGGMVPLIQGVGSGLPVAAGALFAFATTLAREITKDIEDLPGDAQAGARTFPLVAGSRTAGAMAAAVVLVTIASLPAARLFGLGLDFLALSLPAAALLLAACWWVLAATDDEAGRGAASRASGYIKGAMLAGLAALAIAAW